MADLIRLLPDSVANQIAAGEVVQRPASAVKELLENAIDSGADSIRLIIREAGKNLIQVLDNGCGMSERDARICFERHATSKIQTANDLLSIRTLGFRGEALASIASIAQVELKTRRTEDEIGTSVKIDGSEFQSQLPVACARGTSVSVRNLFFNVPARRNFLKSNTVELKNIIDEFFRVVLVNPGTAFTFHTNDKILYQVAPSNLKQRLVALFGSNYNQRLVPADTESAILNISGFIGKPEFAKKTRGEQFFFTNGRFIKSAYLHHAVVSAFSELIPKDAFPTYFLYLELDPKTIDVNIHPTKTEINFQDSKSIYAILHSSVRQAIGKFSMTPSLDFDREPSMDLHTLPEGTVIRQPSITIDPDYNPFEKKVQKQTEIPLSPREQSNQENWTKLYDPLRDFRLKKEPEVFTPPDQNMLPSLDEDLSKSGIKGIFQVQNRYLVTHLLNGVVIIDQQNAHERILYEKYLGLKEEAEVVRQKLLIPVTLTLSAADYDLIIEHLEEYEEVGFEISEFGKNSLLVHSAPSDCRTEDISGLIEKMVEDLREELFNPKNEPRKKIAQTLARSMAIKRGTRLQKEEMTTIVESLFACKVPETTIEGKPTLIRVDYDELTKMFK